MAILRDKLPANVEGPFYVDLSCIDCDTCRWQAPSVFGRENDQSFVKKQPNLDEEQVVLEALLSCPTNSIGVHPRNPQLQMVRESFPKPIEDEVYYCGFHSEKSFAASSYFVRSKEGNVLIDVPRWDPVLVKSLEKLGGIQHIFLTHKDDVGDHARYAEFFHAERWLHKSECKGELSSVENKMSENEAFPWLSDFQVIPTPGHSEGSQCLLYKNKFLFTGDHLAWSVRLQHLYAFVNFCWYDWKTQVNSLESLLQFDFSIVLPGHGRRWQRNTPEQMREDLLVALDWAKAQ